MEEDRRCVVPDLALECVMAYINNPRDCDAVSLVCHQWYEIDALTRKHITITFCHPNSPGRLRQRFTRLGSSFTDRLRQRFPHLQSLEMDNGRPWTTNYGFIPAGPCIKEIAAGGGFNYLKSLHFHQMIVTDVDLELLAKSRGHMLHTLKLEDCSGISTNGLLHVAHSCRCLKTLFLENSIIKEHDSVWLHELASNNTTLENLNFRSTTLRNINIMDLELIARNCRSLYSVNINCGANGCDILKLINFFSCRRVWWRFYHCATRPSC